MTTMPSTAESTSAFRVRTARLLGSEWLTGVSPSRDLGSSRNEADAPRYASALLCQRPARIPDVRKLKIRIEPIQALTQAEHYRAADESTRSRRGNRSNVRAAGSFRSNPR